jgi:hypothetical protein
VCGSSAGENGSRTGELDDYFDVVDACPASKKTRAIHKFIGARSFENHALFESNSVIRKHTNYLRNLPERAVEFSQLRP